MTTPPADISHEQWWFALKTARLAMRRKLPLLDHARHEFSYALPDEVLRETDFVAAHAKGYIGLSAAVTNPATRGTYLVRQLIEESITSSQLEGAATSHQHANDLLRSGRKPRDRSELMILNNYRAMRRVGELRHEPLTLDLIFEIHRMVTDGTLDNADAAGRFQRPDERRVLVLDDHGEILHSPPPAAEIPARMERICEFANEHQSSGYLPGVLRALVVHFMVGYEHPFEDGNGRTARALFYWSMLNQGYWLTEFLSVSRILRKAPARYARSFLHTETDDNDLTYFFIYHLGVLHRALEELDEYLKAQIRDAREQREALSEQAERFNPRQLALLRHALKSPQAAYTVYSHRTSHRVSNETARKDLAQLEMLGLFDRQAGRKLVYVPTPGLSRALERLQPPGGRDE